MTQPSDDQLKIINAPVAPLSVIACAGSGKTFTAVRRLARIRQMLDQHRGRVALLSFSNVAVDTFRREYQLLAQDGHTSMTNARVVIDTLDTFITSNVLRPHAYRAMGAQQTAFLVTGAEPFLKNYQFWPSKTQPRDIVDMQVGIDAGSVYFCYPDIKGETHRLDAAQAVNVVHRLGRIGAYTHNLGRYWCYRTLAEQPGILRALVHRYPHILIDEAQDICTVHQAIIEQLVGAGCQVSLIGDPNQGIYEFAGADGSFLSQYGQREGVSSLELTMNFRSVPPILDLANSLTGRIDTADRGSPSTTHGAFFVPCRSVDREGLIAAFQAAVEAAGLRPERSAVLCRGRDLANKLAGNKGVPGWGIVKRFTQAAILRDRYQDYQGAFKQVAIGIVGLLANPPKGLMTKITQAMRYPEHQALCRHLWAFTRDPDSGLPAVTLNGKTQWHSRFLERVKVLLNKIDQDCGLANVDKLSRKVTTRDLPDGPLLAPANLGGNFHRPRIRVDTVHKAKGESLDAVLYLTTKEHAQGLVDGVDTETGRIGYVAVTRARNLFWLGVPTNALEDLRPRLHDRGFKELDV
ncbi:MAG: DEAD/DEAH box helicase [Halomonas sp.]|nr:DEAD/DEAH box helicase [Halomonas sp.]MBL1270208.1 DEAD/DEAH box helicase [Halomonas sp.]MBL1270645.1 DEAD/DEAH box helicase [Halomonas sp.]